MRYILIFSIECGKIKSAKTYKNYSLWLDKIKNDGSRQVVFLDEIPWLDTPRSHFKSALESFWNNWGCHRNNLMFIVCGSASSYFDHDIWTYSK